MCKYLLTAVLMIAGTLEAMWEPDFRLTSSLSGQGPCTFSMRWLAAAGDNVHVIWGDRRDFNLDVYYKRSTNGGATWRNDVNLADTSATSEWPTIAATGANVYAAWTDDRAGNDEIFFRRSTNSGASWSSAVRLTFNDSISYSPTLACWGEYVYLLWVDGRMRSEYQVFFKISSDRGQTWTQDKELSESGKALYPTIAVWDSMVHAAWVDEREVSYKVYYKHSFDRGVTWSSDMALSSRVGVFPSISVCGMGVHVVWTSIEGEVMYRGSADGGRTWGPEVQLSQPNFGSSSPTVYASGQLVHVAWQEDWYAPQSEIAYRLSRDYGNTWRGEERLTYADGASYLPSLTAEGERVHLVWMDCRHGTTAEAYYKRNPDGNVPAIEEREPVGREVHMLMLVPNPSAGPAQSPGREEEVFTVFDVSGRRVGRYYGRAIGNGLEPGVYIVHGQESGEAARFVKLR